MPPFTTTEESFTMPPFTTHTEESFTMRPFPTKEDTFMIPAMEALFCSNHSGLFYDGNVSEAIDERTVAVRIILFAICLIENSIAIYILHKNLKNGRKTFAGYALISVACSDILRALLYYPAVIVRFSHGEFVWLVQGQVGVVLFQIYSLLVQIPSKVLVLCLVALACDVTRNLSSKGRREHSRKFSTILMIFFWIIAAIASSLYLVTILVISKVEVPDWLQTVARSCLAKGLVTKLIHYILFELPADFILTILNLVIFCRLGRRKKEITRKRKERMAGRMKVRHQRNDRNNLQIVDDATQAEIQLMTEDAQEMLSSKSCSTRLGQPSGADFIVETNQQTSSKPSEAVTDDSSDVHVVQTALEEDFDMTREETKIEAVTSTLFVILSIILMILQTLQIFQYLLQLVYIQYGFFAVQVALDIYGVIKPGIYAYTDKEFRKRYKRLSPFACCCFRRIKCRTVRQQVGVTQDNV